MILTAITFITALCISAVAIYYSVAGLMTIFAAASIPIMIMGGVLEVSKLVTAVWLHKYWNQAVWWLKTYLTAAVVVLMIITSMGIYGYLSKAHIEQTAGTVTAQQSIERIDQEIVRLETAITRAEQEIESAKQKSTNTAQNIQSQIEDEQKRTDRAIARIQPELDRQLQIIERERVDSDLQKQIEIYDANISNVKSLLSSGDIAQVQRLVGVQDDGVLGPNTQASIESYITRQEASKRDLLIESQANEQPNPTIQNAEAEIKRLRTLIEQEIDNSNQVVNRLRDQLGQDNSEQVANIVAEREQTITSSRSQVAELTEQKYEIETDLKLLEVEVGPVKYIAELIYGESDKEILEKSVRWVILIIIFVFDPLAVLLLIASQYSYNLYTRDSKIEEINNLDNILDLSKESFFNEKPKKKPTRKNAVRYSKKDKL